jgi:phage gp36-like protein
MGSQYCTPADVASYALNAVALSSIPMPAQIAACGAASEQLDSYFRGRYPLPLLTWGTDVTMMASYVAAKLMLEQRGTRPMSGADDTTERNYDRAIAWAQGVQRQTVHPDVTFTAQPQTYAFPMVSSPNRLRGW